MRTYKIVKRFAKSKQFPSQIIVVGETKEHALILIQKMAQKYHSTLIDTNKWFITFTNEEDQEVSYIVEREYQFDWVWFLDALKWLLIGAVISALLTTLGGCKEQQDPVVPVATTGSVKFNVSWSTTSSGGSPNSINIQVAYANNFNEAKAKKYIKSESRDKSPAIVEFKEIKSGTYHYVVRTYSPWITNYQSMEKYEAFVVEPGKQTSLNVTIN